MNRSILFFWHGYGSQNVRSGYSGVGPNHENNRNFGQIPLDFRPLVPEPDSLSVNCPLRSST
jgi:hypothetical protein